MLIGHNYSRICYFLSVLCRESSFWGTLGTQNHIIGGAFVWHVQRRGDATLGMHSSSVWFSVRLHSVFPFRTTVVKQLLRWCFLSFLLFSSFFCLHILVPSPQPLPPQRVWKCSVRLLHKIFILQMFLNTSMSAIRWRPWRKCREEEGKCEEIMFRNHKSRVLDCWGVHHLGWLEDGLFLVSQIHVIFYDSDHWE